MTATWAAPTTTTTTAASDGDAARRVAGGCVRSTPPWPWGAFVADDGIGGLQVRQRGEWVDVHVPDGQLVVNLGDLMSIWTNDRWVSNPHRVVNPPRTATWCRCS